MRLLEGAEACFATASGMAAVFTAMAALCGAGRPGRRLARPLRLVLRHPRRDPPALGCRDRLRRRRRPRPVARRPSPARPRRSSSRPRATRCRSSSTSPRSPSSRTPPGATVVVDNVFGTPVFSHPLEHGADVVVYSATKHIDGQGRALGGAVLGPRDFVEGPVKNLMRHTGPSMSPFNAWVMTKGLETLDLRVRAMAGAALDHRPHARGLAARGPRRRTGRPPVPAEPPAARARAAPASTAAAGTVVTFDLDGGKDAAVRLPRRAPPRRHLEQPRRRQVPHDPPRDDHAPPALPGGPRRRRHHRRHRAPLGRPRGPRRPRRGPRPGALRGRGRPADAAHRLLASPPCPPATSSPSSASSRPPGADLRPARRPRGPRAHRRRRLGAGAPAAVGAGSASATASGWT